MKSIRWSIGLLVLVVGIGVFALNFDKPTFTLFTTSEKATEKPEPITCSGKPTEGQIEGPYYTKDSPETDVLDVTDVEGAQLVLTGYVVDTNCEPIVNAWVDFWQAKPDGKYDNEGYVLRGHQYTDKNGKYQLVTVIPGPYPGRTPHIHVKVQAKDGDPILTTQLYFPKVDSNQNDEIYKESLLIQNPAETDKGYSGTFDFVIDTTKE